jgi:2-hydroxychromene-2-carboxylate isomerase
MSRPRVEYFFSFASPYAALADARIDAQIEQAGAELVPIPVVAPPQDPPQGLAATLSEFKRSHMVEDSARCAAALGLPWRFPWDPSAPSNGTAASAGWYFADAKGAERRYRNAVFRARASEGRDITDEEVLADCAEEAGLDRGEFLEALRSRRYHDEVPKAIALCLERRVFGVPLFAVDGKRFWGHDRVDPLLAELRAGR